MLSGKQEGRLGKKLAEADYKVVDQFVEYILDKYRSGLMSRTVAVGNISHVIIASNLDSKDAADPLRSMRAILAGDHE
jgi:hypothetical protein